MRHQCNRPAERQTYPRANRCITEENADAINGRATDNRKTMIECEECRTWFSEMYLFIAHECISGGSASTYTNEVPSRQTHSHAQVPPNTEESGSSDARTSSPASADTGTVWTRPATLLLIDEYKKRMTQINNGKIRKKAAWVQISSVLSSHGYTMTPAQCEGRWKTLIRGLKNVSDHNNKSGNDSKTHPYARELEFISNKPNFRPPYIACSESSVDTTQSSTETTTQATETSDSDSEKPIKIGKRSHTSTKDNKKKSSDPSEPKPKRKSHASEVINVLSDFIKNQQERYENESTRREQMHAERMEIFRGFLSVLKNQGGSGQSG